MSNPSSTNASQKENLLQAKQNNHTNIIQYISLSYKNHNTTRDTFPGEIEVYKQDQASTHTNSFFLVPSMLKIAFINFTLPAVK